jgi:hypothetical protein
MSDSYRAGPPDHPFASLLVSSDGSGATATLQSCRSGFYVLLCAAVCRAGVEPLPGLKKQSARKCRRGFAKHGTGNFKYDTLLHC